jgi:regulator of nonsense transcripts 1
VQPAGYPVPHMPFPPFPGGPHSQPYAIPNRGSLHGPIGAVPPVPQPGGRNFGGAHSSTGGPIGGHLGQQNSQQAMGGMEPAYNFTGLENPSSQPSAGGQMSQTGLMTQVCIMSHI